MAALVQRQFPQVHWWCPQLPPSPRAAMGMVWEQVQQWPHERMAVMGSSLGGFYATWVAERVQCKAVLINPAVDPARDLSHHVGQQTAWHTPEETFYFREAYVQELRDQACGALRHPQNYLALIAKGDEVLDWREMQARYAPCQVVLQEGGDHALSNFTDYLPQVIAHLGLHEAG